MTAATERPQAFVLGQRVRDEATGRIGTLMEVSEWEDPRARTTQWLAFLRPEHGGREWTTEPHQLTVLPPAVKGAV